jgi:hypothetical protein
MAACNGLDMQAVDYLSLFKYCIEPTIEPAYYRAVGDMD